MAAMSLAAVTALAGCSGSTNPSDGGKTTLTVMSWKGVKGQEANMPAINAAFEKANPNITLKFVAIPSGTGYTQKLQTELLGGDGPDVMMVDSGSLPALASAGYLQDLSKQSWAKDVSDGIRPFNTADGKLQAMPMEATGVGLYSNMTVLAKAGITSVPTDWPTLLADMNAVKAAGDTPIELPDKNGWTAALALLNIGATEVPASWGDDFYKGSGSFSSWDSVISKLTQLDTDKYLSWKTELGVDEFSQGVGDFEKGKTAFSLQGAWNLADMQSKKMNVQFTAFPGGDQGTKPSVLVFAGTSWAVNKASKNQEAAEKYLDYWSTPAALTSYLTSEAAISPFTGGKSPSNPATDQFNASYAAGDYQYMQTSTWFGGNAQTGVGSALQAYFLGQTNKTQLVAALDAAGVRKK
jgi:raffinose/stachyose/melibiose transport system substrate-binding protein